jgi:hypothetical protein
MELKKEERRRSSFCHSEDAEHSEVDEESEILRGIFPE